MNLDFISFTFISESAICLSVWVKVSLISFISRLPFFFIRVLSESRAISMNCLFICNRWMSSSISVENYFILNCFNLSLCSMCGTIAQKMIVLVAVKGNFLFVMLGAFYHLRFLLELKKFHNNFIKSYLILVWLILSITFSTGSLWVLWIRAEIALLTNGVITWKDHRLSHYIVEFLMTFWTLHGCCYLFS